MTRFFLLIATLLSASFHLTTATPTPKPPNAPEVISFTVSPDEIDRGGFVHLTWDVRGVDHVDIEQYSGGSYKNSPDVHYDNLPAQGSLTVQLTDGQPAPWHPAEPYIYGADFYLLQPDYPRDGYDIGMLDYKSVTIRCPYDGFFFGTDPYDKFCPIAPAQTIDVLYQAFDNGFMIWRADTQTVYAFYTNPDNVGGPAYAFKPAVYAMMPPAATPTPNATTVNRAIVAEPFATVFANGNTFTDGLGGTTAPAVAYQATFQDSYIFMFGLDVAYLTTPDDQVIKFRTTLYGSAWSFMT